MSKDQPGLEGGGVLDQMFPIDGSWNTPQTIIIEKEVTPDQGLTTQEALTLEHREGEQAGDLSAHEAERQERLLAEGSDLTDRPMTDDEYRAEFARQEDMSAPPEPHSEPVQEAETIPEDHTTDTSQPEQWAVPDQLMQTGNEAVSIEEIPQPGLEGGGVLDDIIPLDGSWEGNPDDVVAEYRAIHEEANLNEELLKQQGAHLEQDEAHEP